MTSSRLKDIKDLIEHECCIEWHVGSATATIPMFIWRQITLEELTLIVFGKAGHVDVSTTVSPDHRTVVLELVQHDLNLS